ncbi:MAG: GAF domain-containing protein [Verrucomicrobiales bacterium]
MDGGVIPTNKEKEKLYADAALRIEGLVTGETDPIARMAGAVSVLHHGLPHYFWTGFYRVVGNELVVGPYQGTPACGRIWWGKGVCGTAWKDGVTQVVEDVHAFEGHIACDASSESEIVVPVRDVEGKVIAVLDVDSQEKGAFNEIDQVWLEKIVTHFKA